MNQQNSLLTEEIGLIIEERADLTPLAARIYAALILTSDEGMTFEELVEMHQASKSSVSNNLNVLAKLNYVAYYTKPGERKRYFRTSKYYIKTAMQTYSQNFERELQMIQKINAYHKENNPEKFKNEQSIGTLYQEYLTELRTGFQARIQLIEQFKNQA